MLLRLLLLSLHSPPASDHTVWQSTQHHKPNSPSSQQSFVYLFFPPLIFISQLHADLPLLAPNVQDLEDIDRDLYRSKELWKVSPRNLVPLPLIREAELA